MAVYVVCDPVSTNKPDKYVLTMDGSAAFEVDPQTMTGGAVRLHYDVTTLTRGTTHNMTVKAKISGVGGGESASVPFSFVLSALPVIPSGIALSES
jgi:hypothetical protein